MKRTHLLYWIWLSRALQGGKRGLESLLEAYGSPFGIYSAAKIDASRLPDVSKSVLTVLAKKDLTEACLILDRCEREGIGILAYCDEAYPDTLRAILDPPAVLYYKGYLPDMNQKMCVGTIGTREMSEYGRDAAYKIAYGLANAGVVIVSGMAKGIDGVCATAAIAAGGETVAFLGSGVDVVYPKRHIPLYEEICRHGAVISEYPPEEKPLSYHFPIRNRLISGASQATLVVEARADSGSLITAQKAIAQGRSVYALLTTATATAAVGAQALLEEGAKPLIGVGQFLSDFIHIYPKALCLENADSEVAVDLPLLSRLGVIDAEDAIEKTKAKEEGKAYPHERKPPSKATARESVRRVSLTEEMLGAMSPAEAAIMRLFFKEEEIPSEQFYSLPYEANEISMALTCLEIAGRIKRTAGSLYRLSAERL